VRWALELEFSVRVPGQRASGPAHMVLHLRRPASCCADALQQILSYAHTRLVWNLGCQAHLTAQCVRVRH